MLALLAPAKKLDFKPLGDDWPVTAPQFETDVNAIAGLMKGLKRRDFASLMSLSESLADLAFERAQAFHPLPSDEGKPAIFAFAGDTYRGFDAAHLSRDDILYAQAHVRILSGLYGLLRPLDRIQPYRLEMGTRLANSRGATLYDFWRDRLTQRLNEEIAALKVSTVVILASEEYTKALDLSKIEARVVTPSFHVIKYGKSRSPGMTVKRLRGAMARHMVKNRFSDAEELLKFDEGHFAFRSDLSRGDAWAFVRDDTVL